LGNLPDFETTGSTAECRGWTSINMRADTERKASPTRPVFDLKRSLMWQLAAVTLLCLLGGVTFAVYRAHEEVVQVNRSLGDAVAKYLEVPFLLTSPKLFTDVSVEELFREAADVFAATMSPGQCLRYLNESGKSVSHCLGFNERGRKAPEWFSSLHRHIIGQLLTYERPVMRRGTMRGRILVLTAPEVVTARAWSDISQLLGLSAATIAALCILVYFVIERALRPAGDIVGALHQLALGNLRCRLPPFRLSELRIISDVFNQVAAALDVAISERSNLARRLVMLGSRSGAILQGNSMTSLRKASVRCAQQRPRSKSRHQTIARLCFPRLRP
jgi:two-component system sensor histidine kinase UhpB